MMDGPHIKAERDRLIAALEAVVALGHANECDRLQDWSNRPCNCSFGIATKALKGS